MAVSDKIKIYPLTQIYFINTLENYSIVLATVQVPRLVKFNRNHNRSRAPKQENSLPRHERAGAVLRYDKQLDLVQRDVFDPHGRGLSVPQLEVVDDSQALGAEDARARQSPVADAKTNM
jgi:hypothetical protein